MKLLFLQRLYTGLLVLLLLGSAYSTYTYLVREPPPEEVCVDDPEDVEISGMHVTDGPTYEKEEVKPPPSLQKLLPQLAAKYGTAKKGWNPQAFIAFWYDTAVKFEKVYGVPAPVQLAVFANETHGGTAGAGRRGAFFGVKAGKTTAAVSIDDPKTKLDIEFNRFGIPDYENLNGIDAKETWSPSVSYTGYSATWLAFAHFNRLLRGIVWTGVVDAKGHPIMKDTESVYEARMRRWLKVGKSLDEAWLLAMAADPDVRLSKTAYHTSGCLCEGSKEQKLKCWKKRVGTATKRIEWIKREYYKSTTYIVEKTDPGVRMGSI